MPDVEITLTSGIFRKRETTYVGSSTVWHEKATGRRAPSHVESQLSGIHALRHRDPRDTEIAVVTGFWRWRRERRYFGNCTVWHDAETGRRAGTLMEARLHKVWERRKAEGATA